jgi:hypothetical protein
MSLLTIKTQSVIIQHNDNPQTLRLLHEVLHKLDTLNSYEKIVDVLLTDNAELRKELEDVFSGEIIPPNVQVKLNALFTKMEENKNKVKAKIDENTKKVSN